MQNKDPKPPTQPSGNQPPPRPPKNTAIAFGPDDNDDPRRKNPKKETVRINLPPKPGAAPTIKLPTLPPTIPLGQSSAASVKLTKAESAPALPQTPARPIRVGVGNAELSMILAAVLLLNGMLYILCRL
jgi:hypothetical protein